jgi:hypothetical protein
VPVFWLFFRLPCHPATRRFSAGQVLVAFLAIYSGWSGFFIQKLFSRFGNRTQRPGWRMSPLLAWRMGHVIRLASALSVCLWAFVLFLLGGAAWLVYFIFVRGVILLLAWKPGASPVQTES